jgi:hypothetical protein
MNEREERRRRLEALAKESEAAADAILDGDLQALKAATRTDLDRLQPKITDKATYDRLIAVIEDSTRKNEPRAAGRPHPCARRRGGRDRQEGDEAARLASVESSVEG